MVFLHNKGEFMYNKAIEILNILEDNNYKAYIIGGYVIDKLLNIESFDIDIVTSATPKEILKIFKKDFTINYGSIKLEYDGYTFDITTFRKDINYIDNRWPDKIEYVSTLKEDIKRRDFTINAIAIDKNNKYIDLESGIDDLNNKKIKCIGNADKKIKEDSLRILRAIRFSSIYNFNLDEELKEAIINNKELINNLSFDRIKKELDIIFSSSNVNLFFNMINYFDMYKTLQIEPINSVIVTNNNLSIWAQLNYSNNYNFSNYEKKYIKDLKYIINNGIDNYTVYKYGVDINKEANKILKSNIDIDKIYSNLPIRSKKDIDITYNELLSIIKDKKIINKIYIDLENKILYNIIKNKKQDIISYLRR